MVRFTPSFGPEYDAGVSYIYQNQFCEGPNLMQLSIQNFGLQGIDSVQVNWTWDGVLQDSVMAYYSMPVGNDTYLVNLDSQNLVVGQNYELKAWTSLPNGTEDSNHANDTMTTYIHAALHGNYTIGGTNPDYNTFADAIADLQSIGICDTVTFNVRPGTYNEQIILNHVDGSFGKQIIFQAENGDSSSVILQFNATSPTANYTVRFNNGHNYLLQHLTLNALGSTYARVIEMQTICFDNIIQHCAINGKDVTSTSNQYYCIYSYSKNTYNTFYHNTIRYGSAGFYHFIPSPGSTDQADGIKLIDNTFLDFYSRGAYAKLTTGIQIHGNIFQSAKTGAGAIQVDTDMDTVSIYDNSIYLSAGSYGVQLSNIDAPTGFHSKVYNNMINIPGTSCFAGISIDNSDRMAVYDNTVRISTAISGHNAFFGNYAQRDTVYNNIFANFGGGTTIYALNLTLSDIDYNDLYVTGSLFGQTNTTIPSLATWQLATGYDEHSFNSNPLFVSSTDLHVANSFLNGTGSPAYFPALDFDGEPRDPVHPDIGADEFVPVATDAAITALLSPLIICESEQNIEIVLANLGADTLQQVTIQWELNGVPQPDTLLSLTLLPEGDTAHVILSNHTFTGQADSLRIWTSMPNGMTDLQNQNDTLATRFRLPLNGIYTIGGTTPDFATIGDAVKDLNRYFTCGPVTFRIRDGVYNEYVEVDSIPTVSAVNTITFESESLDSSAVTIQHAATIGDHPAVFMLKGTDYVTIRYLGFKSLASTWADDIEVRYNSKHIMVSHCYLEAYEFGSSGVGFKSLCYGSPTNEYITLDHNYFYKGQQAIYLYNCGNWDHEIHIENNTFVNQKYTCMSLAFITGLYIQNNTISTNTTYTSFKGIDLSSSDMITEISGNTITLDNSGDGMFLNSMNFSTHLGTARVFNNMVKSAGTGGGIRVWNSETTTVAFNSCNMTGSGPAFELTGGDTITVLNNIFVSNTGQAFGSFSWTPHVDIDYNDLLSLSGNLGYWHDTLYPTFLEWQTGTHFDSNSMSITPQFVSATDLHVLADTLDGAGIPVAGITVDIDNNPRNANTPDIGADEIGANDNDAGVFAILPEMPFARGMQPVKAVIRNYGGNTLTSMDVHWQLNAIDQTPYAYSGSLPTLQQDTVILGMVDFDLSTPYVFKSWTALPNGLVDYYNSNDTLTTASRYAAVSDTLTIAGTAPDFADLTAALTALSLGGVLDSVHFQMRSGTYHMNFTVPQTLGMTCGTPIIFESETGNAGDLIWDNMGLMATTLLLNGADGVEFRNLTIRTVVSNYHAVEFENNAMCNAFIGCHIDGVTTTSSSTTQATVYSNSGGNNGNQFIDNTITKGSYNIYWAGDGQTTGSVVVDNQLQNAYYNAVQFNQLSAPVLSGNIISVGNTGNYFYGIVVTSCDLDTKVTANQVLMTGKRGIGILVNYCRGNTSHRFLLANNFVVMGSGNYGVGIQETYFEYINTYYNTVRMTGGDATNSCFNRVYGTNFDIKNNIFDNRVGGLTLAFNGIEGPLTCDYNDLFTTGSTLVSYGGTGYTDLPAWQATDFDTSSVSTDPMYVSADGYAITSAALNEVGTPVPGVLTDIEGDLRDTLTPDIGCDEIFLATNDVGLLSINYPKEPFPSGVNTVFIKFVNNGQDTLTTMQVDWEVDGNPQSTYMWTGLLPSAGTYDSLDIGTYDFAPYQYHQIKVWVSLPNGFTDGLASNDTLVANNLYPGLMGTYTIGGVNPDFDSISIATYHLNTGGAVGPVTFNIRTGTYLETINLVEYPGSDCDRPVIFQSETGDSSNVIINNLGIDDNIVSLDGTDGVIFQHLTLQSVNPAYRNVISYNNGANCNQFLNDRIIGYNGASSSFSDGVIISSSSLDTANVFENNLIQYGSMGFYLVGNGAATHTRIENNFLDHNYYQGIYASSESAIRIRHNIFQSGGQSSYTGIYLEYCHGDNQIIQNDVQGILGAHMLDIETCYASNGARATVANNFFSALPSFGINGIVIDNSRYYDFIFNNINVKSNSPSTALYFHSDSSLYIANNVIMNSGAGQAIYGNNQAVFNSDYNDIYGTAGFGQWNGGGIADLSAWQSATGQDNHSLSLNPQYMSESNLHISNILLNGAGVTIASITTDIEGDLRNNPPDVGADEFDPSIANDAGIFSYIGPVAPFASGSRPVTVTVKNYGYNLLTSADVRWVINGIEQPVYHWTGSLNSAICDTVIVGYYNFPEHTGHTMIFWSEDPNGVPDSTHINDTLMIEHVYPAMNGTYTVGGVLPDFNLFSELEDALQYGGILGNVNFEIRNGTYSTQFKINNFPRSSYADHVVFESESGDSNLVDIKRDFYHPFNNYTVLLSDAHNIEFRHLTLSSTQGRILELANGSSNININHNRFLGVAITYVSGSHQLIYSNTTTEDTVTIDHNRFEHGDTGILLQGSSGNLEKEVTITNNDLINARYRSIDTYNDDGLKISGNTVLSTEYPHQGIAVTASSNTREISNNDIRMYAGGYYGLYMHYVSGTVATPAVIANNYVLIKSWPYPSSGIYHSLGNYNNFYYNTIRIENANSVAFNDYQSYQHINIRNCIFSNSAGGLTISNSWTSGFSSNTMDYCDLYTTGTNLTYYGNSYYTDLTALQAGNPQNQHSVSAEPLFADDNPDIFQAMCDGHATPVASVTTDINGTVRDGSTPDIGAVEFTLLPHDIGTKLLVAPMTYCGLSNAEDVTIRIQNYGASTETGFDVAYSFNGSGWHVENVGGLTVTPGGTADYTFSTSEDLSQVGTYAFQLYTDLNTDLNPSNDTLWNIEVEHIPALVDPVSNMIPSNGETGLEKTVSLSWAPAPHATRYDIYIWPDGQSQPSQPQVSDITQINTLYSDLSYGTTFNWMVAAQNVCDQTVNGPVQQFSVRKLPDIVIDTVIAPSTAFSGQTIQIEWQVKNLGPGKTQSQLWSDAVFLSTDATLNTSFDTYLGAVQNLTALDSGVAYTNTGLFTIPNGYTGNYYVFVYADRWNNLIESQNNNNWDRTPGTMMINLSPSPDLKVISVTTPTTTFSGQTIPITAVIKNIGTGPTTVSTWHDRVYYGSDPLNFGTGVYLTTLTHNGALPVDSSYTINSSVTIPVGDFGQRYVYVVTDFNGEVFENAAESNNVGISDTIDVILTPPPDLVAYNLQFPDTINNNQVTTLNYTEENQGGSTVPNSSWYDRIYISPAPVFNVNFLTTIGQVNNYGPLAVSDPSGKSLAYTMPLWTSGTYYYYIQLDKGNQVFEYNFESNNTVRSTGTFIVVNPDLRVNGIVHPDTATAGTNVNLSWQIINDGPGKIYSRYWINKIYISNQAVFNVNNATLVKTTTTSVSYQGVGDTLNQSTSVTIPNGISGMWYFHVVADATNTIFENDQEANNTGSSSGAMIINLPPYPDLVARKIVIPDTITAGDLFTLNFEAANVGTAAAGSTSIDSLYLSFSPTWNPISNKVLGRLIGIPALGIGDSLAYTPTLPVSTQQTSNVYYVYIKTDAANNVYEYLGENNNIQRSDPFFIKPAPPVDLHMDTVITSASVVNSGTTLTVTWKVKNNSASAASTAGWQDALYLSVDSILDKDLDLRFFETAAGAGGLVPGASYTKSANVQIPNGLSGNYYLLAVTDYHNINKDIDSLDNYNTRRLNHVASPINIILSPSPDLTPVLFSAPTTAFSGQMFTIIWSIHNGGNATAQNWADKIYLSTDNIISQGDVLLANINHSTANLAAGNDLLDTIDVFVTSQTQGNYILILKTDADNAIYEYLGENNNQISRSISFTPPPPSDLVVANILVPDSTFAGNTVSISWNTLNNGSNPTNGLMREIVYLSEDNLLDVDDQLFGLIDQNLYIPPGGSIPRSITAPVSGVKNGDYHALVQTDARDNIVESNDTNNIGSSIDLMNVAIKQLFLDSLTVDSLYNGRENYFRLEIPLAYQGQNLRITVDGDSTGLYTELYLKYGAVPTLSDFDQKNLYPFQQDQELLYQGLQAGDYYIMLKGQTASASGQQITILAKVVDFELLSVSPNRGSNIGQTTIQLVGTQMDTMRKVYLVRDTSYVVPANAGNPNYPKIYVPGSYQGWNPADGSTILTSSNSNGVYEGYLYFPEDTNYFLLTTSPDWTTIYGDTGGDGSLELNGDTIIVMQSGYYKLSVDLNSSTYSLLLANWDITGSAVKNGSLDEMTYDIEGRYWYIQSDMIAGGFRFIGNHDAGFTFGDTGADGLLESGGTDINIPGDGKYKIKLFLSHPDYTYSIERTDFNLIEATSITDINSYKAYATFNLDGVDPGMYTVRAERWDGKLAELIDGFEVIQGGEEPDLQVTMDYPGEVSKRNVPMKITVYFQNSGDHDLVNKSFRFEAPWGNELARTYEDLISGNTYPLIEIPVEGAFGPPGILPPKAGNVIEIFAWSRPHPTFTLTPNND